MGLYVIYYTVLTCQSPCSELVRFRFFWFGTGNEREFSCGHPLLR